MKKIFVILASLVSLSSFAQMRCVDKLLPVPRPSAGHQLTNTEWTPGAGVGMTVEEAQRAINALVFGKLLCRNQEIEFATAPTCGMVDATIPDSLVCYSSSNLGHFVLTKDSAKNVQIIFNKAKRRR